MNASSITPQFPAGSYGLSQQAKDCIRQVMGPGAQKMIDEYEACERQQDPDILMRPSQMPWNMAPSSASVQGQSPVSCSSVRDVLDAYAGGRLSGEDAIKQSLTLMDELPGDYDQGRFTAATAVFDALKDDPKVGKAMSLGRAMAGKGRFPDYTSYSSFMGQCERYSKPGPGLNPQCMMVLENAESSRPEDLIDLSEKIFSSLPYDDRRPMEKIYVGTRLILELADILKEEHVEGVPAKTQDFLMESRNIRDDFQSLNFAQLLCEPSIKEGFKDYRAFINLYRESESLLEAVAPDNDAVQGTAPVEEEDGYLIIDGLKMKMNDKDSAPGYSFLRLKA